MNQLLLISNRIYNIIFWTSLHFQHFLVLVQFEMLLLFWRKYELFTELTESRVTKCPCEYQIFSFLQWEALFLFNISIFWSQIQLFSTFGLNQDDHDYLKVASHSKCYVCRRHSSTTYSMLSLMESILTTELPKYQAGDNILGSSFGRFWLSSALSFPDKSYSCDKCD